MVEMGTVLPRVLGWVVIWLTVNAAGCLAIAFVLAVVHALYGWNTG